MEEQKRKQNSEKIDLHDEVTKLRRDIDRTRNDAANVDSRRKHLEPLTSSETDQPARPAIVKTEQKDAAGAKDNVLTRNEKVLNKYKSQ